MFPKVSAFLLVLSVVAAAASVAAAVGENVSMMLFLNVAAAATGDVVTVVAGFVSSTCEGIFFFTFVCWGPQKHNNDNKTRTRTKQIIFVYVTLIVSCKIICNQF